MEINLITPDGTGTPFLRIVGHDESEITGLAFSPDGKRFYSSSQRGKSGFAGGTDGCTYEVTGPCRRVGPLVGAGGVTTACVCWPGINPACPERA